MSHIVFIALGTNIGDRIKNLEMARELISSGGRILSESNIYQTPPWGYEDQPPFLNQVIKAETALKPPPLLTFLKSIETELGRRPSFRNAPRVIDLDILFFDNMIINQPDLVVPHPVLHERAFVLVPLMDIGPEMMHPVLGTRIDALITNVDCKDIIRFKK